MCHWLRVVRLRLGGLRSVFLVMGLLLRLGTIIDYVDLVSDHDGCVSISARGLLDASSSGYLRG